MTNSAQSQIPPEMTAVEISEAGGPEVLRPVRRAVPAAGQGEVLIEVAAAGVNRPDVMQRQGAYDPPPGASDLPGLEVAGRIVRCGDGVESFRPGDQVCALVTGGGYAEYCVAPAAQCLPVPENLSLLEGAALPETFFTVWSNVFDRGGLQSGQTILVHGGSSGIGTTAIQMASAFGAEVYVTAGSEEKCRFCEELGARRAINYRSEDFVDVIKKETGKQGVDLVLDMVGGSYVQRNVDCLKPEGKLVFIAFLEGPKAEVNFAKVMLKRLTVTGSTLRARDVTFKAAIAASLQSRVWPLLEQGRIRPVLHRTFALAEACEAHALMESSTHIGKIMLSVQGES